MAETTEDPLLVRSFDLQLLLGALEARGVSGDAFGDLVRAALLLTTPLDRPDLERARRLLLQGILAEVGDTP